MESFYGKLYVFYFMEIILSKSFFGKLYGFYFWQTIHGSITRLHHGNRILGMAKYLIGLRIKTFEDEVTGMEVS